ncbi:unnamed protein product [Closterium sp. NIES-54]
MTEWREPQTFGSRISDSEINHTANKISNPSLSESLLKPHHKPYSEPAPLMFRSHSVSSPLDLRVSSSSTPEFQHPVGNTGGVGDVCVASGDFAACGVGAVGGMGVAYRVAGAARVAATANNTGAASAAGVASVAGAASARGVASVAGDASDAGVACDAGDASDAGVACDAGVANVADAGVANVADAGVACDSSVSSSAAIGGADVVGGDQQKQQQQSHALQQNELLLVQQQEQCHHRHQYLMQRQQQVPLANFHPACSPLKQSLTPTIPSAPNSTLTAATSIAANVYGGSCVAAGAAAGAAAPIASCAAAGVPIIPPPASPPTIFDCTTSLHGFYSTEQGCIEAVEHAVFEKTICMEIGGADSSGGAVLMHNCTAAGFEVPYSVVAAEHPSGEQTGLDQPSTNQPSAEQPSVDQPCVDQPSVDQPRVDQPSVDQPSVDQPSVGQPSVGQPSVGQPSVGQPSVGQPSVGQPSVGQPSVGQPGGEQDCKHHACAAQPILELLCAENLFAAQPTSGELCSAQQHIMADLDLPLPHSSVDLLLLEDEQHSAFAAMDLTTPFSHIEQTGCCAFENSVCSVPFIGATGVGLDVGGEAMDVGGMGYAEDLQHLTVSATDAGICTIDPLEMFLMDDGE